MAGPGGLQPVIVPLNAPQTMPGGLRAGQVFQAVIQGQPGSLSVVIGGTRVPVGDLPHLTPGQVVNGEVVRLAAGLQLRLNPHAAPAAAQTSTATSLPQVVAQVLESLSALGAAEDAAHVLHPAVPANATAVRAVLELFLSDGRLGEALRVLQAGVGDAARAGVLSERLGDAFGLLSSILAFSGDRDVRAMLQDWRRVGRSLEAKIALAIQSGLLEEIPAEAEGELRGLLMRLRHDEPFVRFLRSEGRYRAFQEAADRVLGRLTGAALQNLRGLEHPYLFLDVPTLEDSGFHRMQMHVMGERGGVGKRFDVRNCTVVMDVSLTHLGELWIVLQLVEGQCRCLIRASAENALALLSQEEGAFVEALREAGFSDSHVRFGGWDANRLRAAGQLMRQYPRMDVRA